MFPTMGLQRWLLGLVCLLTLPATSANPLIDYVRSYDLNDYSLGLGVSFSDNIYADESSSSIMYPYLTSFTDEAFIDDWLILSEGDLGFRLVRGDWLVGVVGRVQTLSLDPEGVPRLTGLEQRRWTVEAGPIVGYRGWPVHLQLKHYFELLDRHSGTATQLEFSYPRQTGWGHIIPALEFVYHNGRYNDYYFGVSAEEAGPVFDEYRASGDINTRLKLDVGLRLNRHWLLSLGARYEIFGDEVTSSQLIEDDGRWFGSVGFAYNADIFQSVDEPEAAVSDYSGELRVSFMDARFDTSLRRDLTGFAADSRPVRGSSESLEDILGVSDRDTVAHIYGMLRFARYHRFEFSYVDLSRDGTATLERQYRFGDAVFASGDQVASEVDSRSFRAGYGYSLMLDDQKELGVTAGLHRTEIDVLFVSDKGQVSGSSDVAPVLPVVGLFGSAHLTADVSAEMQVQFFGLEFDRYEGTMATAELNLRYQMGAFGFGVGYGYYRMDLDSTDEDLIGVIEFEHKGPQVFLSVRL